MPTLYQADYEDSPELLRNSPYQSNAEAFRSRVQNAIYCDEERLGTCAQEKLDGLAEELLTFPQVERRLIMRYGADNISAFPTLAGVAYALGKVSSADVCVCRLQALLEDDASEDLVGLSIRRWLAHGGSALPLVEAAFCATDTFIKTMALLGYVIQGRLASCERINAWLLSVSGGEESKMRHIQRSCLEIGKSFMKEQLSLVGVMPHDNWLNIAAYCNTVLNARRNVLARLLVDGEGETARIDVRRSAENQEWVARSKISEDMLDRWLGHTCWQMAVGDAGRVHVSLEEDIGVQFQIGNFYGSCLRLVNGESNWTIMGLITDINKRILVCRTEDRNLIGRMVVGLSSEGLHLSPAYPMHHPKVLAIFGEAAGRLQEILGCRRATEAGDLCARGITAWAYPCDWRVGKETIPDSDPGVPPYEWAD